MKKIALIFSMVIFISVQSNAQVKKSAVVKNTPVESKKNTLGFGFQASLPAWGLSAKYAISDKATIQATIAPFSGGVTKINFYGLRYIHKLKLETPTAIDPYLFGGAGIITYSTDLSSLGVNQKSSDSFSSYSFGAGFEYVTANVLGLSLDLGYGKLSVTNGMALSSLFFGGGVHYYIR